MTKPTTMIRPRLAGVAQRLAGLDQRYVWHPFTQMRDWLKREPIVIVSGKGAELEDARGRRYLDANSSIWTNLHGHNHPTINRAIRAQLGRIAHSSALGLANEPAALLAEALVRATNAPVTPAGSSNGKVRRNPLQPRLTKVFFSDDGSTALEVALKLAFEFTKRARSGGTPRFLSLEGGYHGDTLGAVSLGHIDLFHRAYAPLLFKSDKVMAPYCYRCRYNRAKPERADARNYRKCNWECLEHVQRKFERQKRSGNPYAAFVVEPLIQGAAGMIAQPAGWFGRACEIARAYGALVIADEVMTGFGRAGGYSSGSSQPQTNGEAIATRSSAEAGARLAQRDSASLFASHAEGIQPDILALAKGLTGGYVPMAATLTCGAVFDAFLGEYEEFKTFFHGHSFTGNQIGAAAALASLNLLQTAESARSRFSLQNELRKQLQSLWQHSEVGDVRQVGLIAGVELVKDWRTRQSFELSERVGIRVCDAMARRGVLTRPIGNIIVLMPPYCMSTAQVRQMVGALSKSISEVFNGKQTKGPRRLGRVSGFTFQ